MQGGKLEVGQYLLTVKQYCDSLNSLSLNTSWFSIVTNPNNNDLQAGEYYVISNGQYEAAQGSVVDNSTTYYRLNESDLVPMNPAIAGSSDISQQGVYYYLINSEGYSADYKFSLEWQSDVSPTKKSRIDLEPVIKINTTEGYWNN